MLVLIIFLGLGLAACPGTGGDSFFQAKDAFGGPTPDGAKILSPEEFKMRAQQEGFAWDSLKLRQERIAAADAQFKADETAVRSLVGQSPAYQKALADPPTDGSVQVLKDGNYLLTLEGKSGPFKVVTDGPRNLFRDMLESKRQFQDPANQLRVYRHSFNALPDVLRTGLSTPENLAGAGLEQILNARRELAKRMAANPGAITDAKIVAPIASGAPAQGVNPDAKPPGYPTSPGLEEGSGEGSDHLKGNGCDFNTQDSDGLYKNFWWKQKFYATSVKSQGNRGSCVGFALTAALEGRIAIEKNRWVNLSEQMLWYQIAGIWQPRWYGDGAIMPNRAEDFFEQGYRLALEQTWNYNQAQSRIDNEDDETYSHSCDGYDENCSNSSHQGQYTCTVVGGTNYCAYTRPPATGERFKESEPDTIFDWYNDAFGVPVEEMRLLLKQGHPMVAGLLVNLGFDHPTAEGYQVISSDINNRGRHAVQIVGFIPNADIQSHPNLPAFVKAYASKSGGGYFITKNSWGYCFGDAGYIYISVNWARDYFTQVTVFDVTPSDQFRNVPNIPPTLSIATPSDGLSFPYRQKITLKANATDPDSSTPPTVTWSSDKDGLLGTGAQLEVSFNFPGTRKITAVAADADNGYSPAASVSITGVNNPPVASIQKPLASAQIYKGIALSLLGSATDNDSGGFPSALPCASLEWSSNVDGALGTGCDLEASFNTLGSRTLILTATDADGAKGTATVTITVQNVPSKGPPIVNILQPTQDQIVQATSKVRLSYTAKDPDGGRPLTRQWLIRYPSGGQTVEKLVTPSFDPILQASVFIPSDYVPQNCGGRAAELVLNVTDPQNETGTDKVNIFVSYPPC